MHRQPALAVFALAAAGAGDGGHAVADLQRGLLRGLFADLHDGAGDLMAHDHGRLQAVQSVHDDVDVRGAERAVLDFDLDLIGQCFGLGNLADLDFAGCGIENSFHTGTPFINGLTIFYT